MLREKWRLKTYSPEERTVLSLQVLYLLGISVICILRKVQPTPETLFLAVAGIFVWRSQSRAFIKDFFPFLMMLMAWQAMRGYADNISPNRILVGELIAWEQALFGVVPAVWLRENVWGTAITPWLNGLCHFFYLSHFVTPVVLAAILWQKRRDLYWPFMFGLIALTYAGFLTYILAPAAPPWLASQWGYLPSRTPLLLGQSFPTALQMVSPNHVAAMPSLHAAYPTFIAIFCWWAWGQKGRFMVALPLVVGFSAVWLGHHYVIDLLAGMLYGSLAAAGTIFWIERRTMHARVSVPLLRKAPLPEMALQPEGAGD